MSSLMLMRSSTWSLTISMADPSGPASSALMIVTALEEDSSAMASAKGLYCAAAASVLLLNATTGFCFTSPYCALICLHTLTISSEASNWDSRRRLRRWGRGLGTRATQMETGSEGRRGRRCQSSSVRKGMKGCRRRNPASRQLYSVFRADFFASVSSCVDTTGLITSRYTWHNSLRKKLWRAVVGREKSKVSKPRWTSSTQKLKRERIHFSMEDSAPVGSNEAGATKSSPHLPME
mmetsp:Transcript_22898/g.38321  ORF Transcript_22898/g.38321 Transcript_22898/m.38321 type:complete len:236 (+) Transcript_22898:1-708(+)